MWVTLAGAGLSSRSDIAVLNGANAALVETEAGWELIQYREAELVDVETYKLSGLLRGQQGSEAAAGATIDSRILFLSGAEARLNVADWERGLDLGWRASRGSSNDPAIRRTQDVGESAFAYAAGDQAADFPGGGSARMEVAQLGLDGEPGGWAAIDVEIPA